MRRLDAAVEAGLFVLTVCFVLAHPWNHALVGERQFGDAAYWDLGAESWARGYVRQKAPDIRPGYSLFLGTVYSLTGVDFRWGFAAQAALLALAAVLLYRMGTALGGRLAGLLAGSSLGLNSYLNEWAALSVTETLGMFLNVAALYFLLRALGRAGRWQDAAWFGLLLGYGNTVRPLTLFFLAPGVLAMLLAARGDRPKRLRLAGAAGAAAALPLLLGVLYQYLRAGEMELSSNAASNFYGASSPKYRMWRPEMYDEVAAGLRQRGLPPTPQNMNREFWRLAWKNWVEMPGFQARRIWEGLEKYWKFEGQTERPERYIFFRPYLAALTLAAAALARFRRGERRGAAPAGLAAVFLVVIPQAGIAILRAAGLAAGMWAMLRSRKPRGVMWGLAASYWILVGLSQALVGGSEGFLLHRLYTQVEPVNVLLVSLGVIQVAGWQLRWQARPLGAGWRRAGKALAAIVVAALGAGLARMVWTNLSPPAGSPFPTPSAAELETLAKRAGMTGPVRWVGDRKTFQKLLPVWNSRQRRERIELYAVPGQFSRFIWYQADQDRTLFYFFFSTGTRPESLDGSRLWVEVGRGLRAAEWENRSGLLLLAPANALFLESGNAADFSLLTARAFLPWGAVEPVVFPLQISLVDPQRVKGARLERAAPHGELLRALRLEGGAAITFPDLEIPAGSKFEAWVSVHPRWFKHQQLPPASLELWVDGERAAERVLKGKSEAAEEKYLPWQVDLNKMGRVELKLAVARRAERPEMDEVLVGEPRVVLPAY